jgi:sensor histidine kinase YesM
MILQPLVENSIKHGLARKVGGGRITIKTAVRDGHTIIEVHDDGLGMTGERLERALGDGIGLSNVNERLRTIYGANYHLKLTSVPGEGTCASVEIPELALPEKVTAGWISGRCWSTTAAGARRTRLRSARWAASR